MEQFDVRMHPDAVREYEKIDNSVINQVDRAIDELVERADKDGKNLSNKSSTKLAGCKEIKLRDIGIRIIFKVTNEVVHVLRIVFILSIERRPKGEVFKTANRRHDFLKSLPKVRLNSYLSKMVRWRKKK